MPKVVLIEDYRRESIDQMWQRIRGIRKLIDTVIQDPRSTPRDCERVLKLVTLKDYLMLKAITMSTADQKRSREAAP